MRLDSKTLKPRLIPAIALGATLGIAASSFAAESGVDVGTLTCESVPGSGLNLIVHSTVDIQCTFKASDGSIERYKGETGIGLGIDLDIGHEESFHFSVLAAKFKPGTHQLAGSYAGGKASVSLGVGAGGKLLVGGDHDNIGLKPAAVTGKGVGIAAGLSYMHLEPDHQKTGKTE